MNVEEIKKLIRPLNWSKLEADLQKAPLTEEDVENLVDAVYHSDAVVRRRPNDNGIKKQIPQCA